MVTGIVVCGCCYTQIFLQTNQKFKKSLPGSRLDASPSLQPRNQNLESAEHNYPRQHRRNISLNRLCKFFVAHWHNIFPQPPERSLTRLTACRFEQNINSLFCARNCATMVCNCSTSATSVYVACAEMSIALGTKT